MAIQYVLVTNNPKIECPAGDNVRLQFVNDCSNKVLIAGRDLLHKGWHLMNHPLYGNFRPYQQPFRTLLLREGRSGEVFDEYGLNLLENALDVYANCGRPHVTPQNCFPRFLDDYQTIDRELMQETFIKCGFHR